MTRVLRGDITVHGTDHEDFGPDEHPTGNVVSVEPRVMNSGDGFIDLGMPTVKWGGECRVEVDWEAMLDGNSDVITAHAICRFFEGGSEDTDEMEDQQEHTFPVPKTRSLDPPTQFAVSLRNSTVVGAEDHAEVFFRLENRSFEDE
ncbi:hypothetical protein [Streptomyces flaveolus]|uniref:hypothetical protein n=1 Tax=Streptomyces flaveolus TaxID=67297 RepID=UPI0033FFB338